MKMSNFCDNVQLRSELFKGQIEIKWLYNPVFVCGAINFGGFSYYSTFVKLAYLLR